MVSSDDGLGVSILQMTIPGDPVSKGRPRTGKGHTYTPKRTRDAEKVIELLVRQQMGLTPPVTVMVGVAVEFFCATKRRTDGDNLLKLVTDSMNKIVYADDSQIVEWFARVHRGVGTVGARTEILVWQVADEG
jgi:Holliday junction resolvase RusA-like endonuclease